MPIREILRSPWNRDAGSKEPDAEYPAGEKNGEGCADHDDAPMLFGEIKGRRGHIGPLQVCSDVGGQMQPNTIVCCIGCIGCI